MVTVDCDNDKFAHVFSNDGVKKVEAGWQIPELADDPRSCVLVNLAANLVTPPFPFLACGRKGGVVIAATPDPRHVLPYKERGIGIHRMPTWNWDDLYCGRRVLRHELKVPR